MTATAIGRYAVLLLPLVIIAGFWVFARYDRRKAGAQAPLPFLRRNGLTVGLYLVLAVGLWAIIMIVLPQLYMVEYSFHPKLPPTQQGGPRDIYTLENYRYFIYGSTTRTDSLNYLHLKAFFLTILVSIIVTIVNFVLCYPLAFYMAQTTTAARVRLLMLMLIVPYWINEILRAFAFRVIFGGSGVLNTTLKALGVIDAPIDFLAQDIALYTGLSYAYLLMMVFPLYNAIEALDRNQIEAARDLGAPWWHIHLFVVMPFAKPGIASGCTLVFMLSAGALAAPLVLSGPRSLWFTPIVYDRFYQAFNWPQGAAYAFILLLVCIVFVLAMLRLFKLNLGEITR